MNKYDAALDRVHTLYLLQTKLISSLDSDLRNPQLRKEVRTSVKEFQTLLAQVDWRFMGGTDVLDSLRQLPGEVTQKLKESPVALMKRAGTKKLRVSKVTRTMKKRSKSKSKKRK
jgi:uncharacterized protein YggL (DUF469 family)